MNIINIILWCLLVYFGLILAGLFMACIVGFVALVTNERKSFFWCFYCKKKNNFSDKQIELPKIVIVIEPNGEKKLGIKN